MCQLINKSHLDILQQFLSEFVVLPCCLGQLPTNMTDDVKRYFNGLLQKISGLYFILVTDRDGVPLLRVHNDRTMDVNLLPSFISTFALASDQSSKLGLGKNNTIISMYSNYQVIQLNKLPLIVTFVGTESCNTGHILSLERQIDSYLDEIKLAVTES